MKVYLVVLARFIFAGILCSTTRASACAWPDCSNEYLKNCFCSLAIAPAGGGDGGSANHTPSWPPHLTVRHSVQIQSSLFVPYNNDDDNANNIVDCNENDCTNDDDRIPAYISLCLPEVSGHTVQCTNISVRVSYDNRYLRLWDEDGRTILPSGFSFSATAKNVMLEGVAPSLVNGTPFTITYTVSLSYSNCQYVIPVAGSLTTNVTIFTCDLDIDSDNNNAFDLPDRSSKEEDLEERSGSSTYMGKHLHQNDFDLDNDGIPDFIDGMGKIEAVEGDRIIQGRFTPLVLQLPHGFSSAQPYISFSYSASDPGVLPRMSLNLARNFKESSLAPGFLRIWTKNADQARNAAGIDAGGDYIPSGVGFAFTKLSPDTSGTVTLYLEAVRASTNWGDTITVRVYPSATDSNIYAEDAVNVTATRTVLEVYVRRPYIRTSKGRFAFEFDSSSPQAYFKSFINGLLNAANDYHEKAAYLGHAFARLAVTMPYYAREEWLGKTGGQWYELKNHYEAFRTGTLQWTSSVGWRDSATRLSKLKERHFVRNVCPINNYAGTAPNPAKMVVMHEFRITPSMVDKIRDFVRHHEFKSYGLDIDATKGGCGSFIGLLCASAGINEHRQWLFDKLVPIVPLQTLPAWSLWVALTKPKPVVAKVCAEYCGSLPGYEHNARWTAAWGVPGANLRRLRYYDPAMMARHFDALNTAHPNSFVKDRGVTIYYNPQNY